MTTATDGAAMVVIPAGEFLMGSESGYPNERPVHRVFVEAFALAQHPVTNAQYERFVRDTGRRVPYLDDSRAEADNWDRETTYLSDRTRATSSCAGKLARCPSLL